MTIIGTQFDRAKVTAKNDAALYDAINSGRSFVVPNVLNNMNVTTNALVATINTGRAVIQGRMVEVTVAHPVTIPANSKGFLVLTIDLSKVNSSTGTPGNSNYTFINNQLTARFVTTATTNQLNNNGLVFDFVLGSVTTTANAITFVKNASAYSTALTNVEIAGSFTEPIKHAQFQGWYGTTGYIWRVGNLVVLKHEARNIGSIPSGSVSTEQMPSWAWPIAETTFMAFDQQNNMGQIYIGSDGKYRANGDIRNGYWTISGTYVTNRPWPEI